MMYQSNQRLALVVCGLLVLLVLELVRRKRLGVRYSLIWLGVTVAMAVLTQWTGLLSLAGRAIGATNESSTLFLLGILFSLVILLHFSIKISEYSRQIRLLTKEVGLLQEKLAREASKRD